MKNYYGINTPTDHLAHYGIKGMKWGVRKALREGDSKALRRQYNKAVKKLSKLEKRGNRGSKYAARAAALTGAAGLTGSVAIGGTPLVAKGVRAASSARASIMKGLGQGVVPNSKIVLGGYNKAKAVTDFGKSNSIHQGFNNLIGKTGAKAGNAVNRPSIINQQALKELSAKNAKSQIPFTERLKPAVSMKPQSRNAMLREINQNTMYKTGLTKDINARALKDAASNYNGKEHFAYNPNSITKQGMAFDSYKNNLSKDMNKAIAKKNTLTNDQLVRIGTAGVTAGLLGAAGYNAYRAATAKRNRAKAAEFRKAMQETFKGTEYAKYKGMPAPKKKKRR